MRILFDRRGAKRRVKSGALKLEPKAIPLPPKPLRRGGKFEKRAHYWIASGRVIPLPPQISRSKIQITHQETKILQACFRVE